MPTSRKTKTGTGTSVKQTVKLTPKMRMELSRIIAMTPAELAEDIDNKLQENFALEVVESEKPRDQDGNVIKERQDDGDFWDRDNDPGISFGGLSRGQGDDRPPYEPHDDNDYTIDEHLREQLMADPLTDLQREIIDNIIGNLDSRGYLVRDAASITRDMADKGVTQGQVEEMIRLVRSLDPPGIAAFNLQDLMLLQLDSMELTDDIGTATDIISDCFEELINEKFDLIAAKLDIPQEEVTRIINTVLSHLNLTPAAGFASPAEDVNPDIEPQYIIEYEPGNDVITATVNNRFPELQISQSYKEAVNKDKNKPNLTALERTQDKKINENVATAEFYIRMIKIRQDTMMGILDYVVRHQRDYITSGNEADLHPMVLRDIADSIGVDASTVSRATSGQYVQTPYGLLPMRMFFINEGFNIKHDLQQLIAGEDPQKPLTDSQLAERLKQSGFTVERRTIVKYRESLGIPNSRERAADAKKKLP